MSKTAVSIDRMNQPVSSLLPSAVNCSFCRWTGFAASESRKIPGTTMARRPANWSCLGLGAGSGELCDRDVAEHGVAQRSARTAVVVDVDRQHRLDSADPRPCRAGALEALED
jgi:hypothetical protein